MSYIGVEEGAPRFALANQRPSLPVCAPAITRHVLLRIPNGVNPRWLRHGGARPDCFLVLLSRINRVIDGCYDAFNPAVAAAERHRFLIAARNEKPGDYLHLASDSLFADLTPPGAIYRARLRVDINLETIAFTINIDQIREVTVFQAFQTQTATSQEVLRALYRDGLGLPRPVLDDVFSNEFEVRRDKGAWSKFGAPVENCVVADIRGAVLSASGDITPVAPGDEEFTVTEEAHSLSAGLAAFLKSHGNLVRSFAVDNWQGVADASSAATAPPGLLGTEAVVCGMVNGQALYASPLSLSPRRGQRINYLVVYDGKSQAQLGRFIRRLHVMAELRTSALLDFASSDPDAATPRDLAEANQELRRIGAELTAIESGGADENTRFDEARRHFYALNNCSADGLVFRIERSRYYADAFKTRIQDLRIIRIEGWQPYDEFVRRYLFQIFDLIANIGQRYEALGRRIDRVQSFVIGRQIARQAEATAEQTALIRTQNETAADQSKLIAAQTVGLAGQTTEIASQTASATKLQRRGEDIAILAGTYYGYHVLAEVKILSHSMFVLGEWAAAGIAVGVIVDVILFRRRVREFLIGLVDGLRWTLGTETLPEPATQEQAIRATATGLGTDPTTSRTQAKQSRLPPLPPTT